jgi:ferrochelatase
VGNAFALDFIAGWADEPELAQAFAEQLWPVWAEACAATGSRVPVLFTAHAVPCRTIMSTTTSGAPSMTTASSSAWVGSQKPVPADGIQDYGPASAPDPYPVECKQTAQRIAAALAPVGLTDAGWFFAFQSQGIAGAPWLGPTVPDTLAALAAEGHKGVVLQPVGFLCDHVEILYDIDIDFKQQAKALGLQLWRAASLNDAPTLIRTIASALQRPATRLDSNDIPAAPKRPSRPQPEAVPA